MNDTSLGYFPQAVCSDCKERGCSYRHWGIMVQKGKLGQFCQFCWDRRLELRRQGEIRIPLGLQPPGIPNELAGRRLMVKTKGKMVYLLGVANGGKDDVIIVSVNDLEAESFIRLRVMNLKIGEKFVFRIRESNDNGLFYTAPVVIVNSF